MHEQPRRLPAGPLCAHARAIENQVYVALIGNVGILPDVAKMDILYAQAAVFTPSDLTFARDGIAAEAEANEETVLISDRDLHLQTQARSADTVTPGLDRRPDLFRIVTGLTLSESVTAEYSHGPLGDELLLLIPMLIVALLSVQNAGLITAHFLHWELPLVVMLAAVSHAQPNRD